MASRDKTKVKSAESENFPAHLFKYALLYNQFENKFAKNYEILLQFFFGVLLMSFSPLTVILLKTKWDLLVKTYRCLGTLS